jgi:methyl coenzyme M reductase subunit C
VEVTDNKYNPNTYTAESVKKYETCCLNKIMPKTKTKMNMHEAIIYNIIIKRHVIGKNRIILNHKKRINYT